MRNNLAINLKIPFTQQGIYKNTYLFLSFSICCKACHNRLSIVSILGDCTSYHRKAVLITLELGEVGVSNNYSNNSRDKTFLILFQWVFLSLV